MLNATRCFAAEGFQPAVIGNPLAEDASVMRSTGIVSMVRAIEWNLNHAIAICGSLRLARHTNCATELRWKRLFSLWEPPD